MTDGISVESMVNAIANTVNETINFVWEKQHPQKAAVYREFWRIRRSEMLGAEIMPFCRARAEGWDVPMDHRYHSFALAMRLPDGRVGLTTHSKEKTLAPPREMGDPIREHLLRLATTFDVGKRPAGLPKLPASCRRTLQADGLSPDGIETIAAATRMLEMKIGRRRHKATLVLHHAQEKAWLTAAMEGNVETVPMDQYRWGDIHMTLSRDPRIEITGGKLVARIELPATLVAALPGRNAACFTNHPALVGMTVSKAAQHPKSLVLTLHEDEDHG